jgi:mono/diheme cytochrome c family protein
MVKMLLLRALYFGFCALNVGAQAQTQARIARGQDIAKRLCTSCHAINDQVTQKDAGSKAPSFKTIAANRGATRDSLKIFIMIPKHPMPIVHLRSDEIDDVVAYILSLK